MAAQWVSVAISADVERNVLRIVAVDSKGDIWMLVHSGHEGGTRDTILQQAPNTWVLLTPPHP